MQVFRFNTLNICGIRHLYSAASLGLVGFENTRSRLKSQFHELEDKFKEKMTLYSQDSSHMIFTEDLKHMIHLAERNENDLNLVKSMMLKFSKQNKETRFGSFVFGPVVMRMYYYLNDPIEALDVFKKLQSDGFFDQLISCQILMDLLLKNEMYNEAIDVFEIVKSKQLNGSKYPRNPVVLVLAACFKLNTAESYIYAKKLWTDLREVGQEPMRRAGTFAAALAIQHNEPHVALEILTSLKTQSYITVRNLKISALADLGRPDDAFPVLRDALNSYEQANRKSSICEEVIVKLQGAVNKVGDSGVSKEFSLIEKQLRNSNNIIATPLAELLCTEMQSEKITTQNTSRTQSTRYTRRPGLMDMV